MNHHVSFLVLIFRLIHISINASSVGGWYVRVRVRVLWSNFIGGGKCGGGHRDKENVQRRGVEVPFCNCIFPLDFTKNQIKDWRDSGGGGGGGYFRDALLYPPYPSSPNFFSMIIIGVVVVMVVVIVMKMMPPITWIIIIHCTSIKIFHRYVFKWYDDSSLFWCGFLLTWLKTMTGIAKHYRNQYGPYKCH